MKKKYCTSSLPSLIKKNRSFVLSLSLSLVRSLKDKSKVKDDLVTRFPLKLAENDDVCETVI